MILSENGIDIKLTTNEANKLLDEGIAYMCFECDGDLHLDFNFIGEVEPGSVMATQTSIDAALALAREET